jgi:hypothetical protein
LQTQQLKRRDTGAHQQPIFTHRQQTFGDRTQPLRLRMQAQAQPFQWRGSCLVSNKRCSIIRTAERTRAKVWRW